MRYYDFMRRINKKNSVWRALIDLNEIEVRENPDNPNKKASLAFYSKNERGITAQREMWQLYPIAVSKKQVAVVCPLCGKIHVHGNTNGEYGGTRSPHCSETTEYSYNIVQL